MRIDELMAKRAERGTARGAAGVWHDAQRTVTAPSTEVEGRPVVWFRLALVALGALAVGVLAFGAERFGNVIASGPAEGGEAGEAGESNAGEELPAPTVVEGMDLVAVHRPRGDVEGTSFSIGGDGAIEAVVFAHPVDPFDNPIVGIELFDGGGFRPWGANLGSAPLEDYTDLLTRDGGTWTIDEASGLVEVARLVDDPIDGVRLGWQLDFAAGADEATVQVEPHGGHGIWFWVVRSADRPGAGPVSVSAIPVVGNPGIVIEWGDQADEIAWVDGDTVSRLTANHVEGDTSFQRPATALLPRLRTIDDAAWSRMVADAEQRSPGRLLIGWLALGLAMAVGAAWWWFRRSQRHSGPAALRRPGPQRGGGPSG